MFFFILIFIILLMILTSQLSSLWSFQPLIGWVGIFMAIIVIISAIVYFINITPDHFRKITLALFFFANIILILSKKYTHLIKKKFPAAKIATVFFIACLITAPILTFIFQTGELRFHTNPDIYGTAATSGYFLEFPSYKHLEKDFLKSTGLTVPIWGPIAPGINGSIWQMPDQRIRFSSDLAIGSGRIGLPVLLSMILPLHLALSYFFPSLLLIGILGTIAMVVLLIEITKSSSSLNSGNHNGPCVNSIYYKVAGNVGLLLITSALCIGPWITIQLMEGAIPQIWVSVALLWQLVQSMKYISNSEPTPRNRRQAINVWIAPLFLFFVYPFALVLSIASAVPFGIVLLKNSRTSPSRLKMLGIASLGHVTATLLLLNSAVGKSTIVATSQFLNGAVGGGFHLGWPLFQDLLLFSFSPLILHSSGFTTRATGGDTAAWSFLVVGIFIFITFIAAKITETQRNISTLFYVSFISMIPVLLAIIKGLSSAHSGAPFNDYVYARSLMNFMPYLVSIILIFYTLTSLYFSKIIKTNGTKYTAIFSLIFGLIIYGISCKNISRLYYSYTQLTLRPIPSPLCPTSRRDQKSILFVSDIPRQILTSLSLCGPYLQTNDDWQPNFNPEKKIYTVMTVTLPSKSDTYQFKSVGSFDMSNGLRGKCDIDCVYKNSNFRPF